MQTTRMPDGPLPYDAEIVRIDEKGERHVFAPTSWSTPP